MSDEIVRIRVAAADHPRFGQLGTVRRVIYGAAARNSPSFLPVEFADGTEILSTAQIDVDGPASASAAVAAART
jgi:hypothetical protein